MNIDNITPLVLHVTAKENLNIENDLNSVQQKSLSQLIEDNINEKEKEDKQEEEKC
jgi:hypothetical protein